MAYKKKCDRAIEALCEKLGPEYDLTYIDGERVVHRKFDERFDVEISKAHTNNEKRRVNIYLWFREPYSSYMTVHSMFDVKREDIPAAVEELRKITERLIKNGHDNYRYIMHYKFPELGEEEQHEA